MPEAMGDITLPLQKWRAGDRDAENDLFVRVLPGLRRLAHYLMGGERQGHTLQPTEVVTQVMTAEDSPKDFPGGVRAFFSLIQVSNRDGCRVCLLRPRRLSVIYYCPPTEREMSSPAGEITRLLQAWSAGDRSVEETLFRLVLPDLRNLARALMRRERRDHTLEPTALLNEAYVRLLAGRERDWESRRHFFAVAARIMRRLLIDHARARTKAEVLPLISSRDLLPGPAGQIELAIAVDRLLDELQKNHPDWCSVVELKYFMGLTDDETAEVLGLRLRTMQRQFGDARRWLFERLKPSACEMKATATNS